MDRIKLAKFLLFLMFFIFISDYVAKELYWYSSILWFDMVMHFLGGFWVGLFFIWFLAPKNSSWRELIKVFIGVLIIGVLWEFFEVYIHNYISKYPFDIVDTLSDVSFDLAGGIFAVFYFFKKRIMPETRSRV